MISEYKTYNKNSIAKPTNQSFDEYLNHTFHHKIFIKVNLVLGLKTLISRSLFYC